MSKKKLFSRKTVFLYLIILFVTSFPLTCGYIMEGGVIYGWVIRLQELSINLGGGRFLLFPTADAVLSGGGQNGALDSNLWYLLPALLVGWTGKAVWGWECYMILVQLGTLFTSVLMFRAVFEECGSEDPAFFGVLLYMTCPYRLHICYDLADMAQALVWALLPLYIWAILGILRKNRLFPSLAVAALSLAGIAYANVLFLLVAAGFTLLTVILTRKVLPLLSLGAGVLLSLPCMLRLYYYLFRGAYAEYGIPVQSIMAEGYVPGEFFTIFVYRDGHPGIGLGVLLGLLVLAWLRFVQGQRAKTSSARSICVCMAVFSGILLLMSLQWFPWEYVQRLGVWALKLVALFGTPAVFFGLAQLGLCVVGAWALGEARRQEDETIRVGVPVMVATACLAICIYQCNLLTYTRMPWKL